MGWFQNWQQYNREKYPNAAAFFDGFSQANAKIKPLLVDGAIEGAALTVPASLASGVAPTLLSITIGGLLGAGTAAFKSGYESFHELQHIVSKHFSDVDDLPSYIAPIPQTQACEIFYSLISESLGDNPYALNEIGTTPAQFEQNMQHVLENEKPLSDQTMRALDDATIVFSRNIYLLQGWGLTPSEIDKIEPAMHITLNQHVDTYIKKAKSPQTQSIPLMMNQLFDYAGQIGSALNIPMLQKAPQLGSAMTKIYQGLSTINAIPINAGPLAFIHPLGMVIAGCFSLFSLFNQKKQNQGDNVFQLLFEQLRMLSEQIAEFRREVMEQFEITHRNQRMIFDVICSGFNLTYEAMKHDIFVLGTNATTQLNNISGLLALLSKLNLVGFSTLNVEPLHKTIATIEKMYGQHQAGKSIDLTNKNFNDLMGELIYWVMDHPIVKAKCRDPMLTGSVLVPLQQYGLQESDYLRIVDILSAGHLGQNLGFLLDYANKFMLDKNEKSAEPLVHTLSDINSTINVDLWSVCVDAYIKLRTLGEVTKIAYSDGEDDIGAFMGLGDEVLTLIHAFTQAKMTIFESLYNQGCQTLKKLEQEIRTAVENAIKEDCNRLGFQTHGLVLKDQHVDVHGAKLNLDDATPAPIKIPSEFLLAQELGLGTFQFVGNRTSRGYDTGGPLQDGVWQHSNLSRGVSARYPWADYRIDYCFCVGDKRVILASAELLHQRAAPDYNGWHQEGAGAVGIQQRAAIMAWRAKPDSEFYKAIWNPKGLQFVEVSTDPNLNALRTIIQSCLVEQYAIKKPSILRNTLSLATIKTLIAALASQHVLANAYGCLVGLDRHDKRLETTPLNCIQNLERKILSIADKGEDWIRFFNALQTTLTREKTIVFSILAKSESIDTLSDLHLLIQPVQQVVTQLSRLANLLIVTGNSFTSTPYIFTECDSEDESDQPLSDRCLRMF